MKEVIGVRFRLNGKMYYFDPGETEVRRGKFVIVETSHGIEMGKVVLEKCSVDDLHITGEMKGIIRVATEEDMDRSRENREKSRRAYKVCQQKIRARGLEMKLISADYSFDNAKLLFYFTADGRVDFRELVRDLASTFHTRIELRQVGIRDEARICGGMGMCGRELCCHAYLSDFAPVSIKMAKEQSLSLNPSKISGVCGRLMCCLKNEEETYEYLNAKLPRHGEKVTTYDGISGDVCGVNVLRQTVKIMVTDDEDNREIIERKVDELSFRGRKGKRPEPQEMPGFDLDSLGRKELLSVSGDREEETGGRVRLRSRGETKREDPEDGQREGGRHENRSRKPQNRNQKGDRPHQNHQNHQNQKQNKPSQSGNGNEGGQDRNRRNHHRRRRRPDQGNGAGS